jgi:hypothetical protein
MLITVFDKEFAKWLQIYHEIPPCKLHSIVHFQQKHANL